MALNFPSSPSPGDVFEHYTWDGQKWVIVRDDGPMIVSDTPPTVAAPGQQWFESDTGKTYVYYDDGTSAQWIHTNGAVGSGGGGGDEGLPPDQTGEFPISNFGLTGTSNDLATFQSAVAFAATYGKRISIRMEPTHTLVDNTAADGSSLLILANHVYFVGANGGTVLTLQSSSPNNRAFFQWSGGFTVPAYTLAANAAKDARTVTLNSGAGWAAGNFVYLNQANDGSGLGISRSFIREVKSVAGATLTLKDSIPFAIATTHTLEIYQTNFLVGGGFVGNVHFVGAGVTGNSTRAVQTVACRQWSYENLSFDGFKGSDPGTGSTAAMYMSIGYDNRGVHLRLRDCGSAGFADVTFHRQCFGTFGDLTDEAPASFGPTISQGSRSSFGHHRISGALGTRSQKIQGGVQHHFNSIDVSNGHDTGVYVVLGSDGTQIDAVRVHTCVGDGLTIYTSYDVQIGHVDAQNSFRDIVTITASAQIGFAEVSDISKVSISGDIYIGILRDIANGTNRSYRSDVVGPKRITFTRDLAAASGPVAYTGVGFKPTAIILSGTINGGPVGSYTVLQGMSDKNLSQNSFGYLGSFTITNVANTLFTIADTTNSNNASGTVASYDADGFTINYTKNVAPTGIVTFNALCFP